MGIVGIVGTVGTVKAVCISPEKGTEKQNKGAGTFIVNHGIQGDAHAGPWHRQVSLLSQDKIDAFRAQGADVQDGAFGENLVVAGIDFRSLPVGTILRCNDVVLEMTQIGKECHSHCAIFKRMGDCIMPREGVFARVLQGGVITVGDTLTVPYRVSIITLSDTAAVGKREDRSGPAIRAIVEAAGYSVVDAIILSDEQAPLEAELRRIADERRADLVLTTGGTGFAPRDRTPEATLAVAERLVPGIGEVMRQESLRITNRAMLSRAVAVIRNRTLIINLPGSPKAVEEHLSVILPALAHGLDILTGRDGNCARPGGTLPGGTLPGERRP